jgi:putative transposase
MSGNNDIRRGRHCVFLMHVHVHLLVNYPPKACVSALVNSLKGVSGRMIRQKNYPSIRKKLWGGARWSPSYFAVSCGGAPIAVIRQYIEQQQTPH